MNSFLLYMDGKSHPSDMTSHLIHLTFPFAIYTNYLSSWIYMRNHFMVRSIRFTNQTLKLAVHLIYI